MSAVSSGNFIYNLIHRSDQDTQRLEKIEFAEKCYECANQMTVVGAVAGVVSLIALFWFPILGGSLVVISALCFIFGRDFAVVSQRTQGLLKNEGPDGSSIEEAVDWVFKDTWVAGPVLRVSVVELVRRERSRAIPLGAE